MVAFQKGDAAAFAQLLDKYHKSIVNFIYKIVNNRGEAEELAQDVFLKVYRARERYEPRARFAAWIYRISTNVSLKAAARKRRFLPALGYGKPQRDSPLRREIPPDPAPNAEDRLVLEERARIIGQAIQRLPRKEKLAIILLRYQ